MDKVPTQLPVAGYTLDFVALDEKSKPHTVAGVFCDGHRYVLDSNRDAPVKHDWIKNHKYMYHTLVYVKNVLNE